MCAVPLRVRTDVIGALNVFRGSDEPFTEAEMEIAQAMAEMAAIGLIQERALRERNLLATQLQAALNSRVIIEQAKGMIAEYLDHDRGLRVHSCSGATRATTTASSLKSRATWSTGGSRAPYWISDPASIPSGLPRVHEQGGRCHHAA